MLGLHRPAIASQSSRASRLTLQWGAVELRLASPIRLKPSVPLGSAQREVSWDSMFQADLPKTSVPTSALARCQWHPFNLTSIDRRATDALLPTDFWTGWQVVTQSKLVAMLQSLCMLVLLRATHFVGQAWHPFCRACVAPIFVGHGTHLCWEPLTAGQASLVSLGCLCCAKLSTDLAARCQGKKGGWGEQPRASYSLQHPPSLQLLTSLNSRDSLYSRLGNESS
ncbi:hypothetical protein Psta_0618 [Pirellula staleyi DSM 6068]|uniref:Uncharacterized protein n=1 Tax=Pirellula staleyi (strain ATCC 27377 / DSM 6068 / ICPB 4128) TaxID=530564 RepID=D2R4F7_PIRSD|nr:hypothetical protein Psta_0618 [Pirellula staleyi DSM 6068]